MWRIRPFYSDCVRLNYLTHQQLISQYVISHGTVKLPHIPRPKLKVCMLGDAQHVEESQTKVSEKSTRNNCPYSSCISCRSWRIGDFLSLFFVAREGSIPMDAYHIGLEVWLALSLLTDALALTGQAILASSYSQKNYGEARTVNNLWDILPTGLGDRFVSMLPPWHAYERAVEYLIFALKMDVI
ncbi:unnamed protein product [Lactuca virosa]|uniref:Uncharacterized protein n=1 Tax=Lactuca virosa TaxID=75947 RepID=A0AAU9LXJ8_9ASTR|nr:unnamed protein product [Lactuca virosa]